MLKNTSRTYGHISKWFHWGMAVLFIGMFIIAYIMINIASSNFRFSLYDYHKATGVLLLSLVVLRLIWRLINTPPELPKTVPIWQRRAAQWNIIILYILMFVMPITGFLTSTLSNHHVWFYGIFTFPPLGQFKPASQLFSKAHEIFSYLLIAAFVLHIIGALYHHYFLRDNVVKRML